MEFIRMSNRVLRVVARDPSTKYDIMNVREWNRCAYARMFLGGIIAAIFSHVFDKERGSWPWRQTVCFIGGAASEVATGRSSGYFPCCFVCSV